MTTKILLANDDGYYALGLEKLNDELSKWAEVVVFTPEINHSGASNSLSINRPLSLKKSSKGFNIINGTPSDCVHVALTNFLDFVPDIVVSGINNGANLGEDTLYSGTVAAATEGYLFGYQSIAFSLTHYNWPNIDEAASIANEFVKLIVANPTETKTLLSINIPPKDSYSINDFRVTRLGRRHQSQPVERTKSPFGQELFWIGASGEIMDFGEDTDFYAVDNGYISVTPIQLDMTHYKKLESTKSWLSNVVKTVSE